MRAIGLISGTSMDGIDVALIETNGEEIQSSTLPAITYPYDEETRTLLLKAVQEAAELKDRDARPGSLASAERQVTESHAKAVEAYLEEHHLRRQDIDVVGFHGQTVFHDASAGLTVQLGDGPRMAELLGIDVVYDFRAADMRAGGQGAPLVPVYHRALIEASDLPRPAVIINLGGIANITYVGEDETLIAFDTGPANALLDDWVFRKAGQSCDEDGALAARGKTDGRRLEKLLSDPFFLRRPPKSLDRNAFSLDEIEGLSLEDGATTLTAFTVASLICGLGHIPATPQIFILSGGGVHNATLVRNLRQLLPGRAEIADELGWTADGIEAQAFAFLAVRSLKGLPITFPGTTGIAEPLSGGLLAEASAIRPLADETDEPRLQ